MGSLSILGDSSGFTKTGSQRFDGGDLMTNFRPLCTYVQISSVFYRSLFAIGAKALLTSINKPPCRTRVPMTISFLSATGFLQQNSPVLIDNSV